MSAKQRRLKHRLVVAIAIYLTLFIAWIYINDYPDVYFKEVEETVDGITTIETIPRTAIETQQIKLAWLIGLIMFLVVIYTLLYIFLFHVTY